MCSIQPNYKLFCRLNATFQKPDVQFCVCRIAEVSLKRLSDISSFGFPFQGTMILTCRDKACNAFWWPSISTTCLYQHKDTTWRVLVLTKLHIFILSLLLLVLWAGIIQQEQCHTAKLKPQNRKSSCFEPFWLPVIIECFFWQNTARFLLKTVLKDL